MNDFRPVEFWKESIMTLPDNAFFDLLRSVFGKIKTPYNKQILTGDLEKFLLREDIQKNIACYIDDNDIRIIAAVAALGEPGLGDLENFFAGDLNYAELHDLIVNLEERFILYRFFEKGHDQRTGQKQGQGQGRLALNPVLKSILSPLAADTSLLFPSVSINEAPQDEIAHNKNRIFLDDRILAALLSFVSQNKLFFKTAGGGIRHKILNAAAALFPGLPLETVIGALQVLGLFFAEDEALLPDCRRFTAFGSLDRQERLVYCAAGILCYRDFMESSVSRGASSSREAASSREDDDSAAFSPWLLRSHVHKYAETINRLYNSIDGKRLYPPGTLQKLAYILERIGAETPGAAACGGKIIEVMEQTGLIVPVSDKYWHKAPLTETSPPDAPLIVMDTPFTLLLYPEITYNDAIAIAVFSNVIEAGMTVRFEMSRDSAVSAFNQGITAAAIVELLQRLSHNRINENLSFTLHDWEKRYGEVTLRRGLVLTLSPEQRHLAETKPLARFITETIAPGIYILPESAEERVVQTLHKAGVAIIARRGESGDISHDGESSAGPLRSFFLPLRAARNQPCVGAASRSSQKNSAASILIESFHSILNTTRPKGEERDELAARIDRRLVLCESQLKDAAVRYEKLEARGLDYVGKALIAKQAISLQTPVEVIWPGKQKQERVFGIPKALEKTDGESILIIDTLNEDGAIRVPLGKISLLRRRRKSIFEE